MWNLRTEKKQETDYLHFMQTLPPKKQKKNKMLTTISNNTIWTILERWKAAHNSFYTILTAISL